MVICLFFDKMTLIFVTNQMKNENKEKTKKLNKDEGGEKMIL